MCRARTVLWSYSFGPPRCKSQSRSRAACAWARFRCRLLLRGIAGAPSNRARRKLAHAYYYAFLPRVITSLTDMDSFVGRTLSHYQILDRPGQGGMGSFTGHG